MGIGAQIRLNGAAGTSKAWTVSKREQNGQAEHMRLLKSNFNCGIVKYEYPQNLRACVRPSNAKRETRHGVHKA